MTTVESVLLRHGIFGFLGQAADVQVARWAFYGTALVAVCSLIGVVFTAVWAREVRSRVGPTSLTAAMNTAEHAAASANVTKRMDDMDDRVDKLHDKIDEVASDVRKELRSIHEQLHELAQSLIHYFGNTSKEAHSAEEHQGEGGSGS